MNATGTLRERRPQARADAPSSQETASELEPRSKSLTSKRVHVIASLIVTCLIAGSYWAYKEWYLANASTDRLYTKEELAQYSSDNPNTWYLALLGEVFDVSSGKKHYGPGGDYNFFTGRDASRGFITGKFKEDLNDNIEDFEPSEMKGLVNWVKFYHKDYVYKGKVVGAFYDSAGRPQAVLNKVEEGVKKAEEIEAERERQRQAHPDCNMRWSQAAGGEVWCDDQLYPRKYLVSMDDGKPSYRCACFKDTGWSDFRQVYPDCEVDAHRCKTG